MAAVKQVAAAFVMLLVGVLTALTEWLILLALWLDGPTARYVLGDLARAVEVKWNDNH